MSFWFQATGLRGVSSDLLMGKVLSVLKNTGTMGLGSEGSTLI